MCLHIIKAPGREDHMVGEMLVAHSLTSRKAAKCNKQVSGEGVER